MSVEILTMMAAAVLSLIFQYVPGLEGWYENQSSQIKAAIMLAALIVVAAGAYALSCAGPYDYFECTQAGAWQAAELLLLAIVANQGTHMLFKSIQPAE